MMIPPPSPVSEPSSPAANEPTSDEDRKRKDCHVISGISPAHRFSVRRDRHKRNLNRSGPYFAFT